MRRGDSGLDPRQERPALAGAWVASGGGERTGRLHPGGPERGTAPGGNGDPGAGGHPGRGGDGEDKPSPGWDPRSWSATEKRSSRFSTEPDPDRRRVRPRERTPSVRTRAISDETDRQKYIALADKPLAPFGQPRSLTPLMAGGTLAATHVITEVSIGGERWVQST